MPAITLNPFDPIKPTAAMLGGEPGLGRMGFALGDAMAAADATKRFAKDLQARKAAITEQAGRAIKVMNSTDKKVQASKQEIKKARTASDKQKAQIQGAQAVAARQEATAQSIMLGTRLVRVTGAEKLAAIAAKVADTAPATAEQLVSKAEEILSTPIKVILPASTATAAVVSVQPPAQTPEQVQAAMTSASPADKDMATPNALIAAAQAAPPASVPPVKVTVDNPTPTATPDALVKAATISPVQAGLTRHIPNVAPKVLVAAQGPITERESERIANLFVDPQSQAARNDAWAEIKTIVTALDPLSPNSEVDIDESIQHYDEEDWTKFGLWGIGLGDYLDDAKKLYEKGKEVVTEVVNTVQPGTLPETSSGVDACKLTKTLREQGIKEGQYAPGSAHAYTAEELDARLCKGSRKPLSDAEARACCAKGDCSPSGCKSLGYGTPSAPSGSTPGVSMPSSNTGDCANPGSNAEWYKCACAAGIEREGLESASGTTPTVNADFCKRANLPWGTGGSTPPTAQPRPQAPAGIPTWAKVLGVLGVGLVAYKVAG